MTMIPNKPMINRKCCNTMRTIHLRYKHTFIFYHASPISLVNHFVCLYDYNQEMLVFFTTEEVYDKVQLKNEINDYLTKQRLPILTNNSTYKVISINHLLNVVGFDHDDLKQFRINNNNSKLSFKILKIDPETHSYYNFDISLDVFFKSFIENLKKVTSDLIEFKKSNIQTALNLYKYLLQHDIYNENFIVLSSTSPKLKTSDFNKLITLNKNLNIKDINLQNEIPDDIANYADSLFSFIATLEPIKIPQPSSTYFKLAFSGLTIEIKYNFIKQSSKVNNHIYIRIPGFSNLILTKKMLAAFLNLIDPKSRDLLINKLEIFKLKYI